MPLINAPSFEQMMLDPTVVLPENQETTRKLLYVIATELRRLREDIEAQQERLVTALTEDLPEALERAVQKTTI